jgi:UDP-N-acetyl-2-amino-2-deoxyglucuronate dehydrogenase
LLALKDKLQKQKTDRKHDVVLTYITSRGPWYHVSWKGSLEKSGGVATNIGIHFFDLLQWLFGKPDLIKVYESQPERISGFVEFENANVRWFLSVDENDLPIAITPGQPKTYRSITVDGEEIEFSGGFTELHTLVYEKTLAGSGFDIEDARSSIELTYRIRKAPLAARDDRIHPLLAD